MFELLQTLLTKRNLFVYQWSFLSRLQTVYKFQFLIKEM